MVLTKSLSGTLIQEDHYSEKNDEKLFKSMVTMGPANNTFDARVMESQEILRTSSSVFMD